MHTSQGVLDPRANSLLAFFDCRKRCHGSISTTCLMRGRRAAPSLRSRKANVAGSSRQQRLIGIIFSWQRSLAGLGLLRVDVIVVKALYDQHRISDTEVNRQRNDCGDQACPECSYEIGDVPQKPDGQKP